MAAPIDFRIITQSIISGMIVSALAIPGVLIAASWHAGNLSADVSENTKNIAVLQSTVAETQRLAVLSDQAVKNLVDALKARIEADTREADSVVTLGKQVAAHEVQIKDLQNQVQTRRP